ncbi:MAG: competence protein ComEA [Coxiella sp. (in: Bacteria)]|nr:MAG: competence protein ComEA [Coxiella sp. (in: g-proteobacteria)]
MKKIIWALSMLMGLSAMGIYAKTSHHPRHHVAVQATENAVNINKATVSDLVQLKGIGAKKAQAIVAYRKEHGTFKSLNDLTQVRGISTKMVARIEKENPGKLKVSLDS